MGRKIRKNVGLVLNGPGDPVTSDTEKAGKQIPHFPLFFLERFAFSSLRNQKENLEQDWPSVDESSIGNLYTSGSIQAQKIWWDVPGVLRQLGGHSQLPLKGHGATDRDPWGLEKKKSHFYLPERAWMRIQESTDWSACKGDGTTRPGNLLQMYEGWGGNKV